MKKRKPKFNKRIFWDVDFNKIDYDLRAKWVIERVFERGDVLDIKSCITYYGINLIGKSLINAKHLNLNRIYLAAAIINVPIEKFRCYILRQLNPTLYPY